MGHLACMQILPTFFYTFVQFRSQTQKQWRHNRYQPPWWATWTTCADLSPIYKEDNGQHTLYKHMFGVVDSKKKLKFRFCPIRTCILDFVHVRMYHQKCQRYLNIVIQQLSNSLNACQKQTKIYSINFLLHHWTCERTHFHIHPEGYA